MRILFRTRYPVRPTPRRPGSSPKVGSGLFEFAHPLRSFRITRISSPLRDGPPLADASLLSPFVGCTYRVFASHHRPGSHVPRNSPRPSACPLSAGCRLGSNQVAPRLLWRPSTDLHFDIVLELSTVPWVRLALTFWDPPDTSRCLFPNAHDQSHGAPAAWGGLTAAPAGRRRGGFPHLFRCFVAQADRFITSTAARNCSASPSDSPSPGGGQATIRRSALSAIDLAR